MSKMAEVFTAQERVKELTAQDFWSASEAEQAAMRAEYNECRAVLLSFYGENGDCALIDPWSCQAFSDVYKSVYGVRPTGVHTYKAVHALLEEHRVPDEEGDRFDPDISDWLTTPSDEELAHAQDGADVYGFSPFSCLSALLPGGFLSTGDDIQTASREIGEERR